MDPKQIGHALFKGQGVDDDQRERAATAYRSLTATDQLKALAYGNDIELPPELEISDTHIKLGWFRKVPWKIVGGIYIKHSMRGSYVYLNTTMGEHVVFRSRDSRALRLMQTWLDEALSKYRNSTPDFYHHDTAGRRGGW